MPPPSQGYLTLAGAVVAQAAGLGADPDDPQWAHLSSRRGAPSATTAPPCSSTAPTAPRSSIPSAWPPPRPGPRDRVAPPDVAPGRRHRAGADAPRLGDGDTTHLCAQDADGLGVSLTQSNTLDFGSHLVEPATGVFLHNRGVGFSLVPGHPAEVAPGRRPPHTLSPMLVTDTDGALTHLVGAMGGDAQPQIIVQLLARLLRAGHNPATAITAPRLTLDAPSAGPFRLWWGEDLTVAGRGGRAPGLAGGPDPARPPGADHRRLRPRRGRLRPDHSDRARWHGRPAPGGGIGPPEPRRCRAGAVTGSAMRRPDR